MQDDPPPQGVYEWSPLLEKVGRTVTYWKLRLDNYRLGGVPSTRLQRLHIQLQIETSGQLDSDLIIQHLETAWKNLRQVQRHAAVHRDTHMAKLAEHYAEKRETTKQVELDKMYHIEKVQRAAAKHKWYFKERHGMIRSLLVPDFCHHNMAPIFGILAFTFLLHATMGNDIWPSQPYQLVILAGLWAFQTDWHLLIEHDGWKALSNEDDMVHKLLQRNSTHLSMSGDTPFARGLLSDAVGLDGESAGVDEMLQGTYSIDAQNMTPLMASNEMKSFLAALKLPTSGITGGPIPDMPSTITLQQFKDIFNATKEQTASSPSGLHYGHYKASCESDQLAQVHLLFMVLPFQVGIPLTRWNNSLHCMIQKKAKPFINKLRIVQLYEADFNSLLKYLLGRRLMVHSEKHGLNGHQLYGSRKGRTTYDALITTRVIYDMARVQRSYIISIFNDLKGCYDRIRPALNTITTRRMGLPKNIAICHARTLRQMEHMLRTGFGVSAGSIKWDATTNPGGIGQGNGAGPVSFHSHMLPLEQAYEEETGQHVEYSNPDSTRLFSQWLIGFVDDNTLLMQLNGLGFEAPVEL